jgi:hypothetical protein
MAHTHSAPSLSFFSDRSALVGTHGSAVVGALVATHGSADVAAIQSSHGATIIAPLDLDPHHNLHQPAMSTLILDWVKRAVNAAPNAESLFDLLKLADPDLNPSGIRTVAAREKLYKKLRCEVHPDKHEGPDKDSASAIFQAMTTFYESCADCDFNKKRVIIAEKAEKEVNPKRSRPTLLYKFSAEEQWPTLMERLKDFDSDKSMKDSQKWCYSVRGQIVHHALTGRQAGSVDSTDQVFHKLPSNDVDQVDSIKEELMLHGPVLSTSFKPSAAITAEYGLTPSTVIIMGWRKVQGKGEVWLVRPTPQDQLVEIPVGSCSLTDDVQIPLNDLRNTAWQSPEDFPFLERDFSGETDWMTLSEYEIALSRYGFNTLMQKLRTGGTGGTGEDLGMVEMLSNKRQVEICPVGVRAMSRRADIVDLVCKADGWTLRTRFIDA